MEKAIDFRFNTPEETGLLLSEEAKKAKYTYLIFLRYYGCTSCQVDLMDLSAAYDKFVAKDAQILVVLQSKPEILAQGIETQGIPFKLISDPEQKLYPLYNVQAVDGYEAMQAGMTPEAGQKFAAKMERGAQILVVLQSKPEILAQGIETQGIPFQLISDPEQKLYPLYQVQAVDGYEAMQAGMTPEAGQKFAAKMERGAAAGLSHGEYEGNEYQLPGYFLIDSDMNLLKAHRAENMADMPVGEEYLELI